jgi:hypothetical protein
MSLTQKVYTKLFSNFDLSCPLNSSYENLIECKYLGFFEISKSSFLIFENHDQTLNI